MSILNDNAEGNPVALLRLFIDEMEIPIEMIDEAAFIRAEIDLVDWPDLIDA